MSAANPEQENEQIIERWDNRKILVDNVASATIHRNGISDAMFKEAWQLIPESKLELGKHLRITVNMRRMVGRTVIVKAPTITPTTEAKFARRQTVRGGARLSRILESNGQPPETPMVTMIGDWSDDDEFWMLHTAYFGPYVYPQPWDFTAIALGDHLLSPVLAYWCRAAFLYQPQRFETRPHLDTWARILESAASDHKPDLVEAVHYQDARAIWKRFE